MSQQHAESLAVDMRNTSPHLNMKTMQAASNVVHRAAGLLLATQLCLAPVVAAGEVVM